MKRVLITGASHGIGAATAKAFAREGYRVGVNYFRNPAGAEKVVEEIRNAGGEAEAFGADVTSSVECEKLVEAFLSRFGGIEVLVNNAGGALKIPAGGFIDMPVEYWKSQIELNLSAAAYTSRTASPRVSF